MPGTDGMSQMQAAIEEGEKQKKYYEQEYNTTLAELKQTRAERDSFRDKLNSSAAALTEANAKIEAHESKKKKKKKKNPNKLKLKKRMSQRNAVDDKEGAADANQAQSDDEDETEEAEDVFNFVTFAYQQVIKALPEVPLALVLETQHAFIKADKDGSGRLDAKETASLLSKVLKTEKKMSVETARALIDEVDMDKSGEIDFLEMVLAADKCVKGEFKGLADLMSKNTKVKKSKSGKHIVNGDGSKACIVS